MAPLDFGFFSPGEAFVPKIPWWRLQNEINNLRSSLAALPCGRFGVFLCAVRTAEDSSSTEKEVSLEAMIDTDKDGVEAVENLETAVVQLYEAEDVECMNGALSEVCYILPMPMILPEGDKGLFLQAGAEIDLLYRPGERCFERFFLRVRALTQSGYDLSLFDEAQSVPVRHPASLSWSAFSGISFPWRQVSPER
jgi:hypothetical protein